MEPKQLVIAPNERVLWYWLRHNDISRDDVRRLSTPEHVRGMERGLVVTVLDAPGWTDESWDTVRAAKERGMSLEWVRT